MGLPILGLAAGAAGLTGLRDLYNNYMYGVQRQNALQRQRDSAAQVRGLLGAPERAYEMSEAELFPGEQQIPGLRQEGTGLLGGKTSIPEFYGGLLDVPGMRDVAMSGLLESINPKQSEQTTLYRNIVGAGFRPGTPEFQKVMRDAVMKPQTQINMGGPSTPGWKKADEEFAKDYVGWKASGGFTDAVKNAKQLDTAIQNLESGKAYTGPMQALIPDFVKSVTDPGSLSTRQQVEEVVQRNLRLILGAQFTEKEGERLINRAFDERLPRDESIRRLKILQRQIIDAALAKQEAAQYFDQHGTLQGFQGKTYSLSDFDNLFSKGKEDIPPLPPGFVMESN